MEDHDFYLKTDVSLLTDVFGKSLGHVFKPLWIRPCFFYYTLRNFACDAMLKLTGIEAGLVCDQDMYEMMDAGLRGGMTQTM